MNVDSADKSILGMFHEMKLHSSLYFAASIRFASSYFTSIKPILQSIHYSPSSPHFICIFAILLLIV